MKYLRQILPIDETSKEKAERYLPRAVADFSHVNFARRVTSGKEQEGWARREKNRQKGISRAYDVVDKKNEETELNETENVTLTVPLFIRMLEFAKEDAKTDMDLHKATERLQAIGGVVDMDSYKKIVEDVEKPDVIDSGNLRAPKKKKPTKVGWKGMEKDVPEWGTMTREDVELDEAAKWKKKKGPSQKVDIKTKGDLAKERRERNAAMRGAKRETKETGEKVQFQKFKDWRSVRKTAREKIEEGKSEYSKTKTARGEGEREHFYVDAGRRASHVRDLKDMGMDARHEYSPYSNLAGLSVPKEHAKKVSQHLWPRSRKRKIKEDLQELSHNVLGRYVKKAEKEDNYNLSPEHKKGINLALRKRGEHKYTEIVPPRVRASRDGKKK